MKLYRDVLSQDEMISDAFNITEVDDIIYEVDCKTMMVNPGCEVDIGANASAEEAAEDLADDAIQIIDVTLLSLMIGNSYHQTNLILGCLFNASYFY